jgi:hypothetical protein
MVSSRQKLAWLVTTIGLCGVLVLSCLTGVSDGKGKPDKGGDTTPPIQYEIRFLDIAGSESSYMSAMEMNNSGQVVGYYFHSEDGLDGKLDFGFAFLYDPALDDPSNPVGHAIDLNYLEFNANYGVPDGWVIGGANGINNRGDIVGVLRPTDSKYGEGPRRGCVIDMNASPPELHLIPDQAFSSRAWAWRINEDGDVLGSGDVDGKTHHYLYNPGWYGNAPAWFENFPATTGNFLVLSDRWIDSQLNLVGPAVIGQDELGIFRIAPFAGSIERPDIDGGVWDVNGAGTFCGFGKFEVRVGKKRTELSTWPYLYDTAPILVEPQYSRAKAINAQNDLLVYTGLGTQTGNWYLNHSDHGLFQLDDVITGTPEDLAFWFSAHPGEIIDLNDRDVAAEGAEVSANHFGQILGYHGSCVFVLTPVTTR